MSFNDFKEIFGFWSVNKYLADAKFNYIKLRSQMQTEEQFKQRYKTPEYYLVRIKVQTKGKYTFGVSQHGKRLLPRFSNYEYANCIAHLVKENSDDGSFENCKYVRGQVNNQHRDTYIEVPDMDAGNYWIYIDLEWQPYTFKWFNGMLQFSLNSYGVDDVEFSENMAHKFD